jgi:hypothetical protein
MNVSGYGTIGYGWILLAFPIIGLVLGVFGSAWANSVTSGDPGSPPGGGGPLGLEPAPDPPGGGQASVPAGPRHAPSARHVMARSARY